MREIKFRAIKDDISNPVFVYGSLKYSEGYPCILTDEKNNLWTICLKNTEGQYTGLKDENGKEIYKGDIIKINNGIGIVFYNENNCAWMVDFFKNTTRKRYCLLGNLSSIYIDVVGNKCENPELLK